MAWIFLAALADSASHSNHGCEQSPIVSETDTLKLCCCRELLLANSTELLSGTTLHRSLGPCFQVSTSSSEGSHVRISALQDLVQAWVASEADFTSRSKGLSKKQSQLSSSLKTSLQSGHADLVVWCGDFPRSGMIVDGQLFLPRALEPRISETDGSYLLPTLSSSSYGSNKGGAAGRIGKERFSLQQLWKMGRIPTLTVSQKGYDRQANGAKTISLCGLWRATTGTTMPASFAEWIMGFHIEWTALDAWAMQWFRSKRKRRSKSCQESEVTK